MFSASVLVLNRAWTFADGLVHAGAAGDSGPENAACRVVCACGADDWPGGDSGGGLVVEPLEEAGVFAA